MAAEKIPQSSIPTTGNRKWSGCTNEESKHFEEYPRKLEPYENPSDSHSLVLDKQVDELVGDPYEDHRALDEISIRSGHIDPINIQNPDTDRSKSFDRCKKEGAISFEKQKDQKFSFQVQRGANSVDHQTKLEVMDGDSPGLGIKK